MTIRVLAALVVVCLVGAATADDKQPEKKGPTGTVEGVVSFKGKPLAKAVITFHPDKGKKKFAGKTDDDGQYTVKDVPVGKGQITIEVKAEKGKAPRMVIPTKYAHPKTSALTYEVKKGKQTFGIELR
jgi:hypothetical protein